MKNKKARLEKIKNKLNEGWSERRAAREQESARNSQLCKEWKIEQKKRDDELEALLKRESVRQFRERISRSGQPRIERGGNLPFITRSF